MKVLVTGGGGREHALVWNIAQSSGVKIYAAPGNAGIADFAECLPYKADDIQDLADFAGREGIDLTVVGPEDPLAMGMVDLFDERGLRIFGPNKKAAELEASKAFAKGLMRDNNIPTAPFTVSYNARQARDYIQSNWKDGRKLVVKASGLAKGKGVIVCNTKEQALGAVDRIMVREEFGDAGKCIVIEDRLYGPEASLIGISDSNLTLFFPPAQDYKPVGNGDEGPNTGGMGAYSPVPVLSDEMVNGVMRDAILPTLKTMRTTGKPFKGCMYAAVILTQDGPKILEYNVRFGDPEIQPILMRTKSGLLPYLEACADGKLREMEPLDFDDRAAVCVVLASGGYPGKYEKGKPITGLKDVEADFGDDVFVFHAGTKKDGGRIYTNGGRVLGVTALGDTIDEAADLAYEAAGMIKFDGKYCRIDIGRNVLERGKL